MDRLATPVLSYILDAAGHAPAALACRAFLLAWRECNEDDALWSTALYFGAQPMTPAR